MNVGKSIQIAMAMRGYSGKRMSEMLSVTEPTVSVMRGRPTCSGQMLRKLAQTFDMKVSEFVALGED